MSLSKPAQPGNKEPSLIEQGLKEALSGLVGAVFSSTLVHPIDLIKIRLQVPDSKYKGSWDAFTTILREEGLPAFYNGFAAELLKSSLQNAIYFYCYAFFKHWVLRRMRADPTEGQIMNVIKTISSNRLSSLAEVAEDGKISRVAAAPAQPAAAASSAEKDAKDQNIPIFTNFIIGCLAGCITQIILNPISVIQTRLMTAKGKSASASIWATLMTIVVEEGFWSLWRGILPGLLLTSNPSIQNLVYDRLCSWFITAPSPATSSTTATAAATASTATATVADATMTSTTTTSAPATSTATSAPVAAAAATVGKPQVSATQSFVFGAIGKVAATIVTYPYIMAKVRLQWKGGVAYKGTMDVLWQVLKSEGFWGLYSGLRPQLVKSVLAAALMYLAKNESKALVEAMTRVLLGKSKSA